MGSVPGTFRTAIPSSHAHHAFKTPVVIILDGKTQRSVYQQHLDAKASFIEDERWDQLGNPPVWNLKRQQKMTHCRINSKDGFDRVQAGLAPLRIRRLVVDDSASKERRRVAPAAGTQPDPRLTKKSGYSRRWSILHSSLPSDPVLRPSTGSHFAFWQQANVSRYISEAQRARLRMFP
jgi:hypothetical protein